MIDTKFVLKYLLTDRMTVNPMLFLNTIISVNVPCYNM